MELILKAAMEQMSAKAESSQYSTSAEVKKVSGADALVAELESMKLTSEVTCQCTRKCKTKLCSCFKQNTPCTSKCHPQNNSCVNK